MRRWAAPSLVLLLAAAAPAFGDVGAPPALRDVRIAPRLGERLPLEAALSTWDGRTVRLGDFFDGRRPVLLTLFYSRCPMLCGLVLDGAARAVRGAAPRLGTDYRALSISIDPDETPAAVAARRASVLRSLPGAAPDAWPFVTGERPALQRLAAALGFAYRYDAATRQFAHPAAMFVLTGDGRISRYLYGFDPTAADLEAALGAAAAGTIGQGGVRELLLQCYRYVPALRRHGGAVRALLALSGAAMLLAVVGSVVASVMARRRREVAR